MAYKKSAIVIGAGIHGVCIANELASNGLDVTIFDMHDDLLRETSKGCHNRAHLGYHYPRSLSTVKECLKGLSYFRKHLNDVLYYHGSGYYIVSKEDTKVSADQYEQFCKDADLSYKLEWPADEFVDRRTLEASFMVNEPCYNVNKIREYYKKCLNNHGVDFISGFTIVEVGINDGEFCFYDETGTALALNADVIVSATYARANNIQNMFGVNTEDNIYKFQLTEVPVVKSSKPIPQLTVVDGPFSSIMPYVGTENHYLFYDVVHSVNQQEIGTICPAFSTPKSQWELMIEHGKEYYNFMDDLEYVSSNWGTRPIPTKVVGDSRTTRIVKHDCLPHFYSVLEGKFISAPVAAIDLVEEMKKDGVFD
jgi:glycine/D-amino acid oxidase-like deaminating enzyme